MVLQSASRVITPFPALSAILGTSCRFLQGLHLRHHSSRGKHSLTSRGGMRDVALWFPYSKYIRNKSLH